MSLQSSVSFPALGSVAFVAVSDSRRLDAAWEAVEETVAEFDVACSRFREDSELCALNDAAGSEVRVTPLLLEAVSAALRAARLTDGDVDPTVGQALIALGYDRDFASVDHVGAPRDVSIARVPGWRTVRIDRERSTIRLARGVKLDLGATAKALAADHAAARARAIAGCGVLVGLGGDIATFGPPPRDLGAWRVRVTDDHRAGVDAPGQWISIRSGGLATSSTTVRRWRAAASGASRSGVAGSGAVGSGVAGSGFVHHLVDPATGASVDAVWRTVSVCAASCLDANIASTAAIVRRAAAVDWLCGLGLPSRLVGTSDTVMHVAGWPPDGDDLASGAQPPVEAVLR